MRTLISGSISINVRANNLARHYYRQEFQEELDQAMTKILNQGKKKDFLLKLLERGVDADKVVEFERLIKANNVKGLQELAALLISLDIDVNLIYEHLKEDEYIARFPSYDAMKVIWAMAKAESMAQNVALPGFEKWLEGVADFDVNDCSGDFMEEAEFGFFRIARKKEEKDQR